MSPVACGSLSTRACTTLRVCEHGFLENRSHRKNLAPHSVANDLQSDFLDEHPGGAKILKRMAGKDSSKQFWKYHNAKVLEKQGGKLKIGEVKESAKL